MKSGVRIPHRPPANAAGPPARQRSRPPARHRSRPPARHRSRPAARHRSRPAARHRSRPPARHRSRPAARHRSRPPARQRSRPPARHRGRRRANMDDSCRELAASSGYALPRRDAASRTTWVARERWGRATSSGERGRREHEKQGLGPPALRPALPAPSLPPVPRSGARVPPDLHGRARAHAALDRHPPGLSGDGRAHVGLGRGDEERGAGHQRPLRSRAPPALRGQLPDLRRLLLRLGSVVERAPLDPLLVGLLPDDDPPRGQQAARSASPINGTPGRRRRAPWFPGSAPTSRAAAPPAGRSSAP